MRRVLLSSVLILGPLALGLSACSHVSSVAIGKGDSHASRSHHGHGPPPHAPAHGYRHKHHGHGGVELSFDSDLGVYVVVDLPDHYFWDGYYLRIEDGRWYASTELGGRWSPRSLRSLPPGLRKKHAAHGKSKGKGHPAKGGW